MALDAEFVDIDRRFDDIVRALKYPVGLTDGVFVVTGIDAVDGDSGAVRVPALRVAALAGGLLAVLLLGLVSRTAWFGELADGWRVVLVGTWLVVVTPLVALAAAVAMGRSSRARQSGS
jgi:hypothetical protein